MVGLKHHVQGKDQDYLDATQVHFASSSRENGLRNNRSCGRYFKADVLGISLKYGKMISALRAQNILRTLYAMML